MVKSTQWTSNKYARDANIVWAKLCEAVLKYGHTRPTKSDLNDKPIQELCGTDIIVDSNRPIISMHKRALGYTQLPGEAQWILTGDNTLAGIQKYAPDFKKLSDNGTVLAGAYGPMYREGLNYALDELCQNKHSSRVYIPIYRQPINIHSKDVPCTFGLFYLVEPSKEGLNDKLHMSVNMRANDVWRGTPYDIFNNAMILYDTALRLKEKGYERIEPGNLRLEAQAGSRIYLTDLEATKYSIADWQQPSAKTLVTLNFEDFQSANDLQETLKRIADKEKFTAKGGLDHLQRFQINECNKFENPYKNPSRQSFNPGK
jgi:thymidylate synthase